MLKPGENNEIEVDLARKAAIKSAKDAKANESTGQVLNKGRLSLAILVGKRMMCGTNVLDSKLAKKTRYAENTSVKAATPNSPSTDKSPHRLRFLTESIPDSKNAMISCKNSSNEENAAREIRRMGSDCNPKV